MGKSYFYSRLFGRKIEKTEKDYESFVTAELLFRIQTLKAKDCSCMDCKAELKRCIDYYEKKSGEKVAL